MKLEEMQKIWDSKNNQTLYIMDEQAVEKFVQKKAKSASKRAAFVENIIIIINIVAPIILFTIATLKHKLHFGDYAIVAFMFTTALCTYIYKKRRINSQKIYGQSILNSMENAIHNASYQAKMTKIFLTWYVIGIGVLSVINMIIAETNIWLIGMIIFIFIISLIAGRWEQRACHDKQLEDLISLRQKLVSE